MQAVRAWGPGQEGHSGQGDLAENESGHSRPQGHLGQSLVHAELISEEAAGPGWMEAGTWLEAGQELAWWSQAP